MRFFKRLFLWVKVQYKTHTVRSILITIPAFLLVSVGVMWLCGFFKKEPFSLDTKRSYILADVEKKEPKTLEELLHCDAPSIDTILRSPSILEELKETEYLLDIVDSRIAINNLRDIDRQLSERIDSLSSDKYLYLITNEQQTDGHLERMQELIEEQVGLVSELKVITGRLLTPKEYDSLVAIPLNINIKGIWISPNEALIHMVPSGDWLPEEGYKLYRIINGQKQLVAEKLASPASSLAGCLTVVDKDITHELFAQASLTNDKLSILAMSADEFRNLAYRTDTMEPKSRVSGKLDFIEMQNALITIPANNEQKIPETDIQQGLPIYIQGRLSNDAYSSGTIQSVVLEKFSIIQPKIPSGIDDLLITVQGMKKYELAQSILTARQQILSLSFVNDEYAEAAGFLFKDDLSTLGLTDGTEITYSVETANGEEALLTVKYGEEIKLSKPQGLIGYGLDGNVPLRWEQSLDEKEKSIISGYFIERKLDGEEKFKAINHEPVVVSYTLDETDVFFETPIYFEDSVANGRSCEYRIYSIDIFGRRSEYSDVLKLKVEKISPPKSPVIETPALSSDAKNVSEAVRDAIALNSGKVGIVLPIFSESNDTVRFVIYRSKAEGAKSYGAPEVIANLEYDNPSKSLSTEHVPILEQNPSIEKIKLNKARHILLSEVSDVYPDLVYFDVDIEKGYTYKYWVSAFDSWNNESSWSQSVSVGYPLEDAPKLIDDINISMHMRNLPDYTLEPPGIMHTDFLSYSNLDKSHTYPARQNPADTIVGTIEKAEKEGSFIGNFLLDGNAPSYIDLLFANLPDERYFHMFIGVRGEDILPDGTVRLKWPAYSGDGLKGYAVYRPLFEVKSIEEMQKLSRDEIIQMGRWQRINNVAITQNQIVVGGLTNTPDSLQLFLVCVEPEEPEVGDISIIPVLPKFTNSVINAREGGIVYVSWQVPNDPQVEYYRVYRSEVDSFKKPIDESKLGWTMVGDRVINPVYTERVEQTFAHYYYYKVTSVSHWGVENTVGTNKRFRVPSTKPPQTPNLLLPLSRKDGVQINFSAVSHCDRYEIYRTAIPVIDDIFIKDTLLLDQELLNALFDSPILIDFLLPINRTLSMEMNQSVFMGNTFINPLNKFKTLSLSSSGSILKKLNTLGDTKSLNAYNSILEKAGPLALADYGDLSLEMLKRINWTKVGEVPSDSDTTEAVDPATGLLKPLSFIDTTAEYGVVYLYTVQAWNDDNLGSSRPEPIEATTRRNRAFDPIDGLKGEIKSNVPHLTWNTAKMSPLSPEKCRQDTVGYIVYRSDTENGVYYQASPLLFDNKWDDTDANPFAFNWYKVKVLDTGGYLSEFSKPILVRSIFVTNLVTVIPPFEQVPKPPDLVVPPKLTFSEDKYSVTEGTPFSTKYTLTGTEPITITVKAMTEDGALVDGFSVDATNRKVNASIALRPGVYTVTVTASNSAGKSSGSFKLTVTKKIVIGRPPSLSVREDEYSFRMTNLINFSIQLSASGSQPLTWSLEPLSERTSVPSQASISNNGVLTIDKSIKKDNYSFYVKVSNSYGYDRQQIIISVGTIIIPLGSRALELGSQYKTDSMRCLSFQLKNVSLSINDSMPQYGYYGTAMLDIGYDTLIPVEIKNGAFTKAGANGSGEDILTRGNVYLKEPYELSDIGIKLFSLDVSPHRNKSLVSGTMQSTKNNQNLFGDIFAFEFSDAILKNGNIVLKKDINDIRYEQFHIYGIDELWIRLNGKKTGAKDLISLVGSQVSMKFHLETLKNEELRFEQANLITFDTQGRINGTLYVTEEQCLQLIVPGGAALRVDDAVLTLVDGKAINGMLSGKLVLPFEQGDITGTGAPGTYAGGKHPDSNEMDELASGNVSDEAREVMQEALIHFGETVQQNGLLIVPDDFASQDKCAWIPIYVPSWTGKGFTIENSYMTSARVTERSLDMDLQRSQAIVVTPTAVTVDLDRESFLPKQSGTQTPNETEKPFWVGLVIKGGKLTLPPDFIQSDGGGVIEFTLAEGEMIYDLNGFNYQTYLYNNDGVPADFGEALGSFEEVLVYNCLLDLYANKVNLEINAEVRVDLFQNNWVKVKLYTNKEDNEDGKAGEYLCSVAPTLIENALGNDTDIRINGGWIREEGMHINGEVILPTLETEDYEVRSDTPLAFTDMLVPSDINKVQKKNDPEKKYGSVVLDKPVEIDFQGYTVEVREFDLEYVVSAKKHIRMTMRGAVLLADNIPLSNSTTDSLIVKYPMPLGKPSVIYEDTYSILDTSFDDCIDIRGKLVPKQIQSSSSLMEFETEVLEFAFLKQLKNIPVEANTRFGYDLDKERCYFVIGITPKSSNISFGAGDLKNFTGIIAYNMEIERDEQSRFAFPDNSAQMKNFIKNLNVNKENDSHFAAGVKGTLVIINLCEIRNMYFGFESGPVVDAGGELYLPLDVSAIVGGSSYRKVGSVVMKYSHPERYFSFSMTLDRINLILATVSGSMGFEYSPSLFSVYLGYPETLVGNISIFHVGAGVGFCIDEDGGSFVQAKLEFGFEKEVNVSIVYLYGYIYAGADGCYRFEESVFTLELYLKGGIQGGIRAAGKRFNIINFYLDARGKVVSAAPFDSWDLECSCKVSYSLDLWICSIEGSVSASFNTTIG